MNKPLGVAPGQCRSVLQCAGAAPAMLSADRNAARWVHAGTLFYGL
ncbi:hypothetical protein [Geobacillus kaustophilus]|nr:hypothetical protein [Geobacillus kaustophilus]